MASSMSSTAFYTDHYELTMLDAALRAGVAERPATFEVFTRHLPQGRLHGTFAGLGRLLEALEAFVFDPEQLSWLAERGVVSDRAREWLSGRCFSGTIDAYREGEYYTADSPVLTVSGPFGEAVILETLVLSILNHDSAIASAADVLVRAASNRPIIEMGSRRTDPEGAVAVARAAYLGGFASTSNLEAGRRYGVPTAGTAAHSFTLLFKEEKEAFSAQVACLGPSTTLLVDTYEPEQGIRNAVAAAGSSLGAVRIDSGDLVSEAGRARRLLDELGATHTRVIVTGDLDDHALAALSDAPVDGYGVGTSVVTGLGRPTAGFVYKLVAVTDEPGAPERPVAKRSPGKAGVGGRKWSWRARLGHAPEGFAGPEPRYDRPVWVDLIGFTSKPPADITDARALQHRVVDHGRVVEKVALADARSYLAEQRDKLPAGEPLVSFRLPPPSQPGIVP